MQRFPKVCGCGIRHDAESWLTLRLAGVMELDGGRDLELRNCACRSTIAMPLGVVIAAEAELRRLKRAPVLEVEHALAAVA